MGQGETAEVYEAADMEEVEIGPHSEAENLGFDLAVKCLSDAHIDDTRLVGRFDKEREITRFLSGLRSESFVNVREVLEGTFIGRRFLTMELLEGITLMKLISLEAIKPSDLFEILRLSASILIGLDVMHDQNMVMRDLSPNNISVGVGAKVKLLDFGLTIVDGQDPYALRGHVAGTPEYMSPEACCNGRLDQRSDLYSLGVILYQLFMGHVPIQGMTPEETIMQQVVFDPYPIDKDLPIDVQELIYDLLEKNPDNRYGSAREVGEEILKILKARFPDDVLREFSEFQYFM